MSTQTRIPDSDEGSTSMGLFNDPEQDKEDLRSLNQFMEKAGLLTDDEFFSSLFLCDIVAHRIVADSFVCHNGIQVNR